MLQEKMAEKQLVQALDARVGAFQISETKDGIEIIAEEPIWAFLKKGDFLTLKLRREVPDDGNIRMSDVCTDLLGQSYTKNRIRYVNGVPQNIDPWLKKIWSFPGTTPIFQKINLSGLGALILPHSMLSPTKLKIVLLNQSSLFLGKPESVGEETLFLKASIWLSGRSQAKFPGARIESLKISSFDGSFVDNFHALEEYKLNAERNAKILITASLDCVELECDAQENSVITVERQ